MEGKNDEWRKLGESLQGDYVNKQRKFWASIRSTVKGNQDVGRICDNNGQLLCDEKEVRARWRDYFASLLESDQNSNTRVPGQRVKQRRDQDVNQLVRDCTEKISVEEVCECIRRLKNRKAPGICGIAGEMLKAGGDVIVQWLHRIFCMAWGSGTVPADWRKAQLVPVHKKESRTQCKNYRGISLLSVPGKVYATVLDKRVRAITEGKVLDEQGAFRSKRSCIDQIFTVRQLGEKVIGKNKAMRMVCVDLEKALIELTGSYYGRF